MPRLTDDLPTGNGVANRLLRSAVVSDFLVGSMGWTITFRLSQAAADAVGATTLVLSESCREEAFDGSGNRLDGDEAPAFFLGKVVSGVSIDRQGCLLVEFTRGGSFKLIPAEFSMDWQWILEPEDDLLREYFSIVSVHGEETWFRFPATLVL